ncbi:hypothetical protein CL634_11455 [bacterium]|nr:hypothetical protein [bacterium]
MKKLFEFKVPKEELVKESETLKNDSGDEVTTIKEVKKTVDKQYFLRKPTRKLFDEAELYYGIKLAEGIKAGLLTRALLQKRFSNDGGVLGEKEKEEWGELYSSLFDKQVELQALSLKTTEQRNAEENIRYEDLKTFIKDSRLRIQEFEMQQSSLYDQTAENRARNKTILWWVLHLAYYIDNDGKERTFFGDEEYEEKINVYDKMEETEDDYVVECINKYFYYVSFWYVSKTSDPQQFKDLIKFAEQSDLDEEPVVEEVEPVEEKPAKKRATKKKKKVKTEDSEEKPKDEGSSEKE